jgi:hypothetical protein
MNRLVFPRFLYVALAIFASTAVDAAASVITGFGDSFFPGVSFATIGPIGITPAPGNDNAAVPNPNVVPYSIFFNDFGGPIDLEFKLEASGSTTEYRVTQTIVNVSPFTWTGFRFELGFGLGRSFVRSGALDFLDFDTPDGDPAPVANAFPTLAWADDELTWSGGLVGFVGVLALSFAIDLPDGLEGFNPSGLNRFTIRQVPVIPAAVPEPALLALVAGGLAGLANRFRVRH